MPANQAKLPIDRPGRLQTSRSFTRFEPNGRTDASPKRSRASTLANEALSQVPSDPLSDKLLPYASPPSVVASSNTSVFERPVGDSDVEVSTDRHGGSALTSPLENLPPDFDALPIEIANWADRFVADLTNAKVFPQPPNIDTLSDIFQEFYIKAESKISLHIKALAARQSQTNSSTPNAVKRPRPSPRLGSAASRDELRRSATASSSDASQPMLTPGEVHEKRRAKKLLEYKRLMLEEAIERRVTQVLYEKLWRHQSSLDDVRDEKLRGKTGSLQLVGIGLKELGVELETGPSNDNDDNQTSAERAVMVEDWISRASQGLLKMNDADHPKGKLDELIAAHQRIVDLLTKVHRGSSSADEILPTLIYTLIACPPDGLNLISNLNFIQRFRASNKMNGEAAYCLTNLEAAITFLETVDLASLRGDEAVSNDPSCTVHNQPSTPLTATFNPQKQNVPASAVQSTTDVFAQTERIGTYVNMSDDQPTSFRPGSSQTTMALHHRRLSSLMAIPTNAFITANDAVRNTADQSLRTVSATLDNSFKLLFGRLREQQVAQGNDDKNSLKSPVVVPKTLDEARMLVTPTKVDFDDGASENSSLLDIDNEHPLKERDEADDDDDERLDDKVLGLIAGRGRAPVMAGIRDRSVDSKASDTSSARVKTSATSSPLATNSASGALDNAAEAFRTFGSSINPLNRLSGTGFISMRGFGRNTPQIVEAAVATPLKENEQKQRPRSTSQRASDGQLASTAIAKLALPPRQQFVESRNVSELKVGDLQDLLEDYHRLADYLKLNNLI